MNKIHQSEYNLLSLDMNTRMIYHFLQVHIVAVAAKHNNSNCSKISNVITRIGITLWVITFGTLLQFELLCFAATATIYHSIIDDHVIHKCITTYCLLSFNIMYKNKNVLTQSGNCRSDTAERFNVKLYYSLSFSID